MDCTEVELDSLDSDVCISVTDELSVFVLLSDVDICLVVVLSVEIPEVVSETVISEVTPVVSCTDVVIISVMCV